jgi:hypothetical protein
MPNNRQKLTEKHSSQDNFSKRIEKVPVSDNEDMENVKHKIEIEDNDGNIDYIYQQWAGECGETI